MLERVRAASYQRVVLETMETWADAVVFYERRGFRETGPCAGEVHMALGVEPAGRIEGSGRHDR